MCAGRSIDTAFSLLLLNLGALPSEERLEERAFDTASRSLSPPSQLCPASVPSLRRRVAVLGEDVHALL